MGESGRMSYSEAFSNQKSEALKAIALDDTRAEPHLELAAAAMDQDWDWTTQKSELQRALDLSPNSATVVSDYANYLSRVGRCKEASQESQTALALDPVSSRAYLGASFIFYFCRQYDVARDLLQRGTQLPHRPDETYFPLGVIDVEIGKYDEAVDQFRKIGDMPHALGHMGNALARQGRVREAEDAIEKLKRHIASDGIGRYEVALVYAGLRQNDNAFEWLEKAFQVHDKGLTYLKVDPCLDPLRSDPRFAALVKRVGIPD
jgi:tetratricopeptide (TPR) repeat protein